MVCYKYSVFSEKEFGTWRLNLYILMAAFYLPLSTPYPMYWRLSSPHRQHNQPISSIQYAVALYGYHVIISNALLGLDCLISASDM